MVVLWLVREVKSDVPVLFNNTGIQYPETIEFKERLVKEFGINLLETKPEVTYWQILERIQKKGFRIDDGRKHSNICCYHLKHKPSKKAIQENGFQVNFDGLTAIESRHRMFIACHKGMEYYTKKLGVQVVHPIMFWTPEEVFDYCSRVQIPVNPVYEKYNLDRVGCVPCTSHREWRAQLAKTNPKMYKFISEKYFGQKVFA